MHEFCSEASFFYGYEHGIVVVWNLQRKSSKSQVIPKQNTYPANRVGVALSENKKKYRKICYRESAKVKCIHCAL